MFGSTATSVNWLIAQADGSGGLPGTIVASGSGTPLTAAAGPTGASFATTDYSFSVGAVSLAAGSYYLGIQAVTSNFSDFLSLGVAGSGAAESDDGGVTWYSPYSPAEFSSVAVSLSSNNVPEPGSLALLLAGLAGLGVSRGRKTA